MQEAGMMDFKFDVNLQQICLVKIAASLWGDKDMKEKVEFFVQKTYKKSDFEEQNVFHWSRVMKDALRLVNNLSLPAKFTSTVKHITRSMGLKIYSWIRFMSKTLLLDSICIEDVFWTQYGTLNKIKIFENWVKTERLEITQLFNIACFLYKEDSIFSLWEKIPPAVKKSNFYTKTIYEESTYSHIAYWRNRIENNSIRYFETSAFHVNQELSKGSQMVGHVSALPTPAHYSLSRCLGLFVSPVTNARGYEENLINLSVTRGLEFAIQHFWDKLDDADGKKLGFFVRYLYQKESIPEYTDTIIFIVTKMFRKESKKFTAEECFGLLILLSNHPWDQFYLPMFDRISKYANLVDILENAPKFDFLKLLEKIIGLMNHEFELYGSVDNSVYQNFLHETWKRMPTWARLMKMAEWDSEFNEIVAKLLLIEDIESVKLIVNSNEFRTERFKRLKNIFWAFIGHSGIFLVLTDRQIGLMHKLADEVELEDEERVIFKQYCCKPSSFKI